MAQLLSGTRIYGTATIDSQLFVRGNNNATSTNTGALQVVGGVGIGGNLWVGGTINGTFIGNVTTATSIKNGSTGTLLYQSAPSVTSFVGAGTLGQLLVSQGSTSTGPIFVNASSIGVGFANSAINLSTGTAQAVVYQSSTGSTAFLAPSIVGYILQTNSATSAPSWVNPNNLSVGSIVTIGINSATAHFPTFVNSNNTIATGEELYTTSTFAVIPSTGRVGLGTITPSSVLSIQGPSTNGLLRLVPTSANGEVSMGFYPDTAGTVITQNWLIGANISNWLLTNNQFAIGRGSTPMAVINTSGYMAVGLGNTTTISKLTVIDSIAISNATGAQRLLMGNRDAGGINRPTIIDSADGVLRFGTGTNWSIENGGSITEWMRITINGGIAFGGATNYGVGGNVLVSKGDAPPLWTAIGSLSAGIATTSTQVWTAAINSNAAHYLTFVNSNNTTATGEFVYTTSSFVINPNTGFVGIGSTSTPAGNLQIYGNLDRNILVTGGTAGTVSVQLGNSAAASQGGMWYDNAVESLYFKSFGIEGMRIDSNRNVLIGTTSSRVINLVQNAFEIEGQTASSSGASIIRNQNSSAGPALNFGKTRSISAGGVTAVHANDQLGSITFSGSDAAGLTVSSEIRAQAQTTATASVVPGYLTFHTANFAGTLTERVRITSAGGISFSSSTNYGSTGTVLQSNGNAPPTWVNPSNFPTNTATNIAGGTSGQILYQTTSGATSFAGPGTAGQVLISAGPTLTGPVFINTSSLIVGTAINLTGGPVYSIPYQSNTSTTALLAPSNVGYVLQTNSATIAPSWISPSLLTAGISQQVQTTSTFNSAIHYLTFVDSNNKPGTGESIYTTSSFTINPNNGFVGVGTTSTRTKLHVNGTITIEGGNIVGPSAVNTLTISADTTATNGGYIQLHSSLASTNPSSIVFGTSGGIAGEKMRMLPSGAISFGNSGSAVGSNGNVLQSQGVNGVPVWVDVGELTAGNASTVSTEGVTSSTNVDYYPTFVRNNHISGPLASALLTSSTFSINIINRQLTFLGSGRFTTPVNGTIGAVVLRSDSRNTATSYLQWTDNTSTRQYGFIGVTTASNMLFATSSTEHMRITSSGTVGIGTNSPVYRLQVMGGQIYGDQSPIFTPNVHLWNSLSTYSSLNFYNTATYASTAPRHGAVEVQYNTLMNIKTDINIPINFATSGTDRMVIDGDGIVNIKGSTVALNYPNLNQGIAHSTNFGGNFEANIWNTANPTTYGSTGIRFMQAKTVSTFTDTVFISHTGAVGFGGTTNVGIAGQVLASNGANAAPTWISAITATGGGGTTSATSVNAVFYPTIVDSNNATQLAEQFYTTSSFNVNPSTGYHGIGTAAAKAKVHVYGLGQTIANLTDAGARGDVLRLSGAGSAAGTGGVLSFASEQGDITGTLGSIGFAAIKGYLTNGNNNTVGDMVFATRNGILDTNLTEQMRLCGGGAGLRLSTTVGLDAGKYFYFGHESLFTGGTETDATDFGYITFDNNNTTYGSGGGGETNALRIGTGNDGASGDCVVLEPTGDIYFRSRGINGGGTGLGAIYVGTYATKVLSIDMTGNLIANGNVTAYGAASDINLKENVVRLEGSLLKVQKLKGYNFNYIGKEDKLMGVVAQEVEQVVPEVVYDFKHTDGETYKAVRYEHLTALLIEAINEQQTIIEQQQKQINQILEILAKQ